MRAPEGVDFSGPRGLNAPAFGSTISDRVGNFKPAARRIGQMTIRERRTSRAWSVSGPHFCWPPNAVVIR